MKSLRAVAFLLFSTMAWGSPAAASSNGWHWLNPLPDGNFVTAVACATGGPCYAVGANGTVLMTHDRGRTWTDLPSGTALDLFGITCPASTTCYAVSNTDGAVFVTTDGARTWGVHRLNRAWGLFRLSCPNNLTCYALGTDFTYECHLPGCNLHGKENVLVRTGDGGRTWQRLNTGDTPGLNGLACPITRTCYLAGDAGTILVTRDAGAIWHRQGATVADPHVSLHTVACQSTSQCLIGGDGVLLATHNNGAIWTKVSPPPGIHFGFDDLTCANTIICLGIGSSEPPHHRLYDSIVLAISTLGNQAQVSVRGIMLGRSIACSDPHDCHIAGSMNSPASSTDGGRHWTNRLRGDREELDQIVCPTVSSCRAVGKGRLLATEDGGQTWTSHGPVVGDDYGNGSGLFCLSPNVCYAGRSFGRILKTDDGGQTWQSERNPETGTAVEFSSVSCPTSSVCFSAGSGCRQDPCRQEEQPMSVVVETVNSGLSWRRVYYRQQTFLHFSSLACPSSKVCYLVGSPAVIVSTQDGGKTWHDLPTPADGTSLAFSSIACATTRSCVAVGTGCTGSYGCSPSGFGSAILHTSDGGRTWQETTPPLPPGDQSKLCDLTGCIQGVSLSRAACPSAQRCWIVGSLGAIDSSSDGGASWQSEPSGTDTNLRGIACPSTTRCYAVGDAGVVLGLN